MLEPLMKQEGVTRTEKHLARIAEDAFFGLWSYPNVYRDEGITKNGIGQEVADLIVLFGRDMIIFSDKDVAFPRHKDLKIAWSRWYRAAVKDSANQLYGAEAFIRKNPNRLFLDKKCTIAFPVEINPNEIRIHLVALARNSTVRAREYFDSLISGSSGSLIQSYWMGEKQALDNPFNITDVNPQRKFIHVFDDFSFDLVLLHLGTIADFVNYLNEKESAVRHKKLGQVAGEEDFLGYYLNSMSERGFGKISLPNKLPNEFFVMIPECWWTGFCASKSYLLFDSIRKEAGPWSRIIMEFSEAISTAKVGEGEDLPFIKHERAVRALASENLVSRSLLAKSLIEKCEEVPSGLRSARLVCDVPPYSVASGFRVRGLM